MAVFAPQLWACSAIPIFEGLSEAFEIIFRQRKLDSEIALFLGLFL